MKELLPYDAQRVMCKNGMLPILATNFHGLVHPSSFSRKRWGPVTVGS